MNSSTAVTIFKALSDAKRMQMIHLLGERECTVGELEANLQLSQSATSQHLKLLKDAGLVSYRKHGNFRIYKLQKSKLQEVMQFFDQFWDKGLNTLKSKLEENENQ